MKAKLKVDLQWLKKETKSMSKMQKDYKAWESEIIRKAREADDLRSLRDVFYELGPRWEWDQATGAWLEKGEPLDAIGLVLRIPGLNPKKERFVVYIVMAYSKGMTDQFDHLGDKERVIIERDIESGKFYSWSTTGHGMMDLYPASLSGFNSIDDILKKCFLVAQPGDHALRLELPQDHPDSTALNELLWAIVTGRISFRTKEIDMLGPREMEDVLDFKFNRYAQAVIDLERKWLELSGTVVAKAKERVLDRIPDHIEEKNKMLLRRIEGLLHLLWFKPAFKQLKPIQELYAEFESEPTPTEVQRELVQHLGELAYSLKDVMEKAQYLKWRSVMDSKAFSQSGAFEGLELSNLAKEAFAVALEDMLREHTLAYIGYPERATWKNKIMRTLFGIVVLPVRLAMTFYENVKSAIIKLLPSKEETEEPVTEDSSGPKEET